MRYTITVAKSNLGNYHLSAIVAEYSQRPRFIPICGAKPTQRRRRHEDDTEGLLEATRKWHNTIHADLRCPNCSEQATTRVAAS